MITFKQFLSESKSAPLYHATSVYNASNIYHSKTLKPTLSLDTPSYMARRSGKATNFLTRSLKHAKYYGNEMHGSRELVIFEINQQKLNQKYKISPIRNWRNTSDNNSPMYKGIPFGNEFEEMVEKPITSFMRYVDAIHISKRAEYETEDLVYVIVENHPHIKIIKY